MIENVSAIHESRVKRALPLGVALGIALVMVAIFLWLLQSVTPAGAKAGALYVDGATGQDEVSCGTTSAPCKTISYTVNSRAMVGDAIRVAQGTYEENLTITLSVQLEGGYEADGWTRDIGEYETIIDGSGSPTDIGDWDGRNVAKAAVISDSTEYKIWFDGINLTLEQQVGLASSNDGISWTKYLTNPVLTGDVGAWDEFGEHAPYILKDGNIYKMWYEGNNGDVRQLGYATSTNGIDWNKYASNPVLAAGPEGHDEVVAGHGSLLKDGGYKLWYHAVGDEGAIIAYATSPDGLDWSKQGPVLHPGEEGEWDEIALWGPTVLKLKGVYWMWYSGWGPDGAGIGAVTSTNGISWTHITSGPVITGTNPIGDPHVISDGGKLKMWYTDYEQWSLNYAESADGISWVKYKGNPVLSPGDLVDQWGAPVITIQAEDVVLDGLTIAGGESQFAGGVWAEVNTVIRDCLIRDNFADGAPDHQGGAGVLGPGPLTIVDSRIVNNWGIEGASGVRVHDNGPLLMTNTLVADNTGDDGIHLNSSATIVNSTLANNSVDTGRPGINFNPQSGGSLVVLNSILYGNGDPIHHPDGATITITYSDIQGGWSGAGNIDEDPQFVDETSGDYHLPAGSPAIDTGANTGAPPADIEGNPRPLDGNFDGVATTDMGAYEYRPHSVYLPIILKDSE